MTRSGRQHYNNYYCCFNIVLLADLVGVALHTVQAVIAHIQLQIFG